MIKEKFKDAFKIKKGENNKRSIENLIVLGILLIITIVAINYILSGNSKKSKNITNSQGKTLATEETKTSEQIGENIENKLENILSKIKGVGNVKVLVTYSQTNQIIPMYNEEESLPHLYSRLVALGEKIENYDLEFLFVYDGSKDNTLPILMERADIDKNVKVISFARNFGHQCAVTAGLQYVTGDAIVIIDADLQDPPELIPDMLKLWEDGNDVIYGKRKSREGESKFKLLTASMFYKTLNALSDVEIPKDTGDFRLVDRKVVDVINSLPEHNKFLRGLFSWVGFKQTPFEYERKERFAGKTKYPLKKMLKLAQDGIFSFSTKPLRIVGTMGIISIAISIIILIYAILSYIFNWNNLAAGWTSLMVTMTFLSGMILISLWMIGEYIGRIYDETKRRPQYIIEKTINIDEK